MITNLLNKRIEVEIETTTKGGVGSPKETYIHLKFTWGGIEFTGGRTQTDQNGENVSSDAIFTLRYDPRYNYKCRFKYAGQYYKITHIEPIGRNEGYRFRTIKFENE